MNSLFWERVSREAKDLISKMLICNPEERLTIHDVFNHPWIAKVVFKKRKLMFIFQNAYVIRIIRCSTKPNK